MRRLLILASTMVFFDVAFYAAIAPLLPDYVAEFDLSKAEAGVLAASYAAGTLLASLPAGLVATWAGPRRTVIGGLLLLGCSSLVFGLAHEIVLLDTARFAQGVAGALIWSGALTWLITTAPPERRGSVIGTALGTAVAGALVGPILGAIAAEVGTEAVFSAVLGIAVLLAALAARLPEAGPPERQPLREVGATILTRPILTATAFVAVPSLMFGAVEVLVPLRIDELGGGHVAIAGGFIAGAALEAGLAPIVGRYSDRVGRRIPFVIGIGICACAMVGLAAAQALGPVLAALILGVARCRHLLRPGADDTLGDCRPQRSPSGLCGRPLQHGLGGGQTAGALVGGGVASAAGYAVPEPRDRRAAPRHRRLRLPLSGAAHCHSRLRVRPQTG